MIQKRVLRAVALTAVVGLGIATRAVDPIQHPARLANVQAAIGGSSGTRTMDPPSRPASQNAEATPDLSGYPDAAVPHLLAWGQFHDIRSGPVNLRLDRILVQPQSAENTRRSAGPILFYVEEGRIAFSVNGRVETVDQGSHTIVQPNRIYSMFNEGFQTATLLSLRLAPSEGTLPLSDSTVRAVPLYAPPDITPFVPNLSGESIASTIFEGEIDNVLPMVPLWGFIASVTWPPGTEFGDHAHSGPVGLSVTSGAIAVLGSTLEAGACVLIPAHAVHQVGIPADTDAPAEILMAGVFEVGEKLVVPASSTTVEGALLPYSCGDEPL